MSTTLEELFFKEIKANTILTLNYDLILQRSLEINSIWGTNTYGILDEIPKMDDSPIISQDELNHMSLLLPLHGCLDMFTCHNNYCNNYNKMIIKSVENPVITGNMCRCCGRQIEMVIVPPSLLKRYEKLMPKISLMWAIALDRIQSADNVILWGLSIAPSDYELSRLLREGLNSGITGKRNLKGVDVINPDPQAVYRTLNHLGSSATSAKIRWFPNHECYPSTPSVEGYITDMRSKVKEKEKMEKEGDITDMKSKEKEKMEKADKEVS